MTPTSAASPFVIRLARREELELLPDLERDATQRFHDLPELLNVPDDVTPMSELEEAFEQGLVWVAEFVGEIAGYAYAAPLDGHLHLEEISVLPRFGRRGIGRAIVLEVIDRARRDGYTGVTLTTFRDVAWNAPFYASLGFRVLQPAEMHSGIRQAMEAEARRGLPSEMRVAMVYSRDGNA